jgi:hypothetical protein
MQMGQELIVGKQMKVLKIERVSSRPGGIETPAWTSRGYELASPKTGGKKHHAANATYVRTLDEAADLIENLGYSLRMHRPGKRPSLISPKSLRIVRA